MAAVPSRRALARVLQSLLQVELAAARGKRGTARPSNLPAGSWSEDARITGFGPSDLCCDSLEALWLSSAACEMFDLASVNRHHALAGSDRFGEWLDLVEDAWREGLSTITFSTSGSTGRAKRCTHELASLASEAAHFASLFGDRRRVLAFVPPHHIYGFLFTALLPDRIEADTLDIQPAIEALGALQPGDLIIAFPDRWQWIARVVRCFGPNIRGVTSTAPCPRDLAEALIETGLAELTEVYGSSETAGIGTRRWPETAYRLLPRWSFADETGGDLLVESSGATVALLDAVQRIGGDGFIPTGRLDGAVQVGGINVYPERVAAALRARPGVAEAAVRLMRPEEGSRLKAFIVIDGSMTQDALSAALTGWLAETMESASRPVAFSFGDALPRNPLGKLADW